MAIHSPLKKSFQHEPGDVTRSDLLCVQMSDDLAAATKYLVESPFFKFVQPISDAAWAYPTARLR